MFARCVYGPLRSAARLVFHVTFSAASGGQSASPLVGGGGVRGLREREQETFLCLEVNVDGERGGKKKNTRASAGCLMAFGTSCPGV